MAQMQRYSTAALVMLGLIRGGQSVEGQQAEQAALAKAAQWGIGPLVVMLTGLTSSRNLTCVPLSASAERGQG